MAIVALGILLAVAIQLNGAKTNVQATINATNSDELCRPIVGTPFHAQCLRSAVVKRKGFVPRHLRPPWIKTSLFDDNELIEDNAGENGPKCYACYKGTHASNGMAPGEEYCACTYNGQLPHEKFGIVFGTLSLTRPFCLKDLQEIAFMPGCGNKYYDHVKHCAMVHFYENDPEKEPPLYGEPNTKTARTLALFDGCIIGASKNCTANVKIEYEETDGSVNCIDKYIRQTVFEGTIQINEYNEAYGLSGASPFTFPAEFRNRHCWDPISYYIEVFFERITITLSGECGSTKFELPESLHAGYATWGRVQEMRGLQLNLKNGEISQWQRDIISGQYYEEKANLRWQPTDLNVIDDFGRPDKSLSYYVGEIKPKNKT